MISRKKPWICLTASGIGGVVIALAGLNGCGGGESDAPAARSARPVARPTAPPPARRSAATSVAQLMSDLRIDERVMLAEDLAPKNNEDRVAVLEFFDAFARGDAETLRTMMSPVDQAELDALVEAGVWEETIAGITQIELETGRSPNGDKCALAIFEVDWDYQPQLWYYHSLGVGEYEFDAVACPPDIMNKLYGEDFIAKWHEILDEELALADKPDEEFEKPDVVLDEEEEEERSSSRGVGGGGKSPGRKPGGPGRRTPPKKKRRPPGPGGR